MKREKDNWIENVVASAAEFRKVQPSAGMDNKIFDAVAGRTQVVVVNFKQARYSIAAAVALILLNVAVLAKFRKNDEKQSQTYLQSYNLDIY